MKLLQILLFSILMGLAVTAHAVNQDVQVDLLMSKITSSLKANQAVDALPYFSELEGIESSLTKPLPESFHFYYIDALDKSGDKVKAISRADIYLNKYGKNGKYYGQVIEIMGRLQIQIEKDKKVAAEEKVRIQQNINYQCNQVFEELSRHTMNWYLQSQERLDMKNEIYARLRELKKSAEWDAPCQKISGY
jgi:hypothetical protein